MPPKRTPATPPPAPPCPPYMLIEEIRVQGYKSLVDATLHVRPLTLLAGTNSSGKSSIMQPLLLIKQTMEAVYQPAGALLLSGSHVQAENANELVSKIGEKNTFSVKISGQDITFKEKDTQAYNSLELTYETSGDIINLLTQISDYGTGSKHILKPVNSLSLEISEPDYGFTRFLPTDTSGGEVFEDGPFLALKFTGTEGEWAVTYAPGTPLSPALASLMHIPGLRGAPKRSYSATFFKTAIRGTFDLYAAGTVSQWQEQNNTEALAQLNDSLRRLGLTDTVTAKVKNANEVELSVSRLPAGTKGKARKADMVNIADVGIGVSQVLPILVALIAAQPGQLVYIEQPELHLHPRAQVVMAELLAEAANRGVRVVVETHSSLLLLTVQTLIAQGRIQNTDVAMHWFSRDARGATKVDYVQPDEDGACGDWPEDFGDVELKAQDAYLTAVGRRHFGAAPQV